MRGSDRLLPVRLRSLLATNDFGRRIYYYPKTDSIRLIYYKRSVSDSSIHYKEKEWIQEIKVDRKNDIVLISIPWYDLGMIAAEDRIFGFASFVTESKKKAIAMPNSAKSKIPGTWGNVVLKN